MNCIHGETMRQRQKERVLERIKQIVGKFEHLDPDDDESASEIFGDVLFTARVDLQANSNNYFVTTTECHLNDKIVYLEDSLVAIKRLLKDLKFVRKHGKLLEEMRKNNEN